MDTMPHVVQSTNGVVDSTELGKAKELLKPQAGTYPDCFADGFFSGIDFSILWFQHTWRIPLLRDELSSIKCTRVLDES
jgi:hypothetical protein